MSASLDNIFLRTSFPRLSSDRPPGKEVPVKNQRWQKNGRDLFPVYCPHTHISLECGKMSWNREGFRATSFFVLAVCRSAPHVLPVEFLCEFLWYVGGVDSLFLMCIYALFEFWLVRSFVCVCACMRVVLALEDRFQFGESTKRSVNVCSFRSLLDFSMNFGCGFFRENNGGYSFVWWSCIDDLLLIIICEL